MFTSDEIIKVTRGTIARGRTKDAPGRLVFELRDVKKDDWYVASQVGIDGLDDSLEAALGLGAQGCIVGSRRRFSANLNSGAIISVASTKIAIMELASYWRDMTACKVVTVTGTRGRKDTIAHLEYLLKGKFRCHSALERGEAGCLPELLNMPINTELLIGEVSGVNIGDIASVGYYLKPDLAIITPSSHPLPSKERDRRAAALNCEILETIDESKPGMAVIFDDNSAMRERARELDDGLNIVYFSESSSKAPEDRSKEITNSRDIDKSRDAATESVWCALRAAECLGFSVKENSHLVSEVLVL